MEAAFSKDDLGETFDASLNDDEQIEEVTTDFLKTQPLDKADLEQLEVESEEQYQPVSTSRDTGDLPTDFIPVTQLDSSGFSDELETGSAQTAETPEPDQIDTASVTNEDDEVVGKFETLDELRGVAKTEGSESEGSEVEAPAMSPDVDTETVEETAEFVGESRVEVSDVPVEEEAEQIAPERTGRVEDDSVSVPTPDGLVASPLDEMNLLELPPLSGGGHSAELNEDENAEVDRLLNSFESGSSQAPAAIEASDDFFVEKPRFEIDAPAEKKNGFEEQLSQEMVERITHRVIEALSEKAIKDIAWEVVPEMAEIIIKKMAQEEMEN